MSRVRTVNRRKAKSLAFLALPFYFSLTITQFAIGAEKKWTGVDESVVERYAEEAGRSAWKPFINTDQGDLLLFVFLAAGLIGGFIIGYYWRVLFKDKAKD